MRLVRRTFGTALAELESDKSEPFLSERSICIERSPIEFFPNILLYFPLISLLWRPLCLDLKENELTFLAEKLFKIISEDIWPAALSSLPDCSFPAHWLVIFLFLIKGINYSFHFALNRGKIAWIKTSFSSWYCISIHHLLIHMFCESEISSLRREAEVVN